MKKHLTRLAVLLVVAGMLAVTIQVAIPREAFAQQPNNDLIAQVYRADSTSLPSTATSAKAGTVRTTTRGWGTFLGNNSQTSVTNPTVSIQSGYDLSRYAFSWNNQPVTAFPVTDSQSSLGPGGGLFPSNGLDSNIPVTYTLGYNSTRSVSPSKIPVGGTNQRVHITVTLVDSRYVLAPPNVSGGISIFVGSNLSGVSLMSTTNPKNLNQGEMLNASVVPSPYLFQWGLSFVQLHKTYSFWATLHVPNASGHSFTYRPFVSMAGYRITILCVACSGSSVTVADATLDGNVPGSGSATFSVDETDHTWTRTLFDQYGIIYEGT